MKKSQSKVTHCTTTIEPLNKSSPQPRRGELGSRSYSVYGHLKPPTSPRLQNYMSLLFTLPLELDWTEFLPLALNNWRFGIITLIPSLVLTLISHSKSCSLLRRLKCHLLYMFLTLSVPTPHCDNCSRTEPDWLHFGVLKNHYPPDISKTWLFSAADTLLGNFFVFHACLLSVSIFSWCVFLCLPIWISSTHQQ